MKELILEERDLPPFNRIHFKGAGTVYIQQGDQQKVEVASDKEDTLDRINTKVKRGTLVISLQGFLPIILLSNPTIEVIITLPELEGVRLSGVGKVQGEDLFETEDITLRNSGVGQIAMSLNANRVFSKLSGTGDIVLEGSAEEHVVELSGIGKVDAKDLVARRVKVSSQGVGETLVNATDTLKIRATGIGEVRYRGEASVDSRKSGLGDISKMKK